MNNMSDEFYRKQEIWIRHGKGYRQYPFSFVELVNPSTNEVLGSGLMPDGDSVRQFEPPKTELDGIPQTVKESSYDPDFVYKNTLASGMLWSRFV